MARVLVVEDSPEQARLIAGLLRSGGFTTDIADSGEQAIEVMARETPDLVVTDLMLPGLNGLEVVEWVVSHHPLVPVILMTAFGSGEIATRSLQKGAASYVPKRMLHEDLISTVEDTLTLAEERREQAQLLPFLEGSEHHFVLENDPDLIPPLAAFLREGVRNCSEEFDDTELL
jgi:DNA-binding NtrC family response regulator